MKKINFRKTVSTLMAVSVAVGSLSVINASAAVSDDATVELLATESFSQLPQAVDLSTSPCFPPIGCQGNNGSCVAWATTYYQYSYEVNKLNGVTSVEDREIYSPYFVYNLTNGGYDNGISEIDAYTTLQNLGCLKLEDFEYTNYRTWPNASHREKQIEALGTRLSSYSTIAIPSNQNISSPSNLATNNIALSNVKTLLNDGKVLVAGTSGNFNYATVGDKQIAYRSYGEQGATGHEITIVGYDNFLEYDVNGNGTIETYERGAFKVADSWGTSGDENRDPAEDGFYWVMYDALNLVSTNTDTDWEDEYSDTTRYPAFTNSTGSNLFYYITVEHKDVKLVGEIKLNVLYKYSMDIFYNRTAASQTTYLTSGQTLLHPYRSLGYTSQAYVNGSVIFDLCNYTDGVANYWNGYNYHVKLSNITLSPNNQTARFRLLDNLGNVVVDYEADDSAQANSPRKYKTMNMSLGDVNYDGVLTEADATFVMSMVTQTVSSSYFQKDLADYNQDGRVSLPDVLAIRSAIASTSQNTDELDAMILSYINETGIENNSIIF